MKIVIVNGVISRNNKLLLLKKFSKNYYETPGGKQKENESLESCLIRELQEEIGVKPLKFRKFLDLKLEFENKKITDHAFLVESFQGSPKIVETEIFEKMEWLDLEKAEKENLAPNVIEIIKKLKKGNT